MIALFIILLQVETPIAPTTVNSMVEVIKAIGSVLTILITAASPFLVIWFNKKMNVVAVTAKQTNDKVHEVAGKVDGLLEEKSAADKAIGEKKATDVMEKTASDIQEGIDKGVQQEKKDQALRDLPPK